MNDVRLPAIAKDSSTALEQITRALGVPREIIASDAEISRAWDQLPRLLSMIPPQLRSELHARMCVAIAAGLFDSAINYAWNSAVVALRTKVRAFGLHVVPQIIQKEFDEQKLLDLKDAELLELCLSLNLIAEDAFFFLDQCRDIRNNFSSAHPPMGAIDDAEFIAFLNRCAKYALSSTSNPKGVDTHGLIKAVKTAKFVGHQKHEWVDRIAATHEAQQELIFTMLHGIYCDASSSEEARLNALSLCEAFADKFTPKTKSELLNRHSDYVAEAKTDRQTASQIFFEKLGLLSLLSDIERHVVVSAACKRLLTVHQGWDNFYNEAPFAERLLSLSTQVPIPDSAKTEFVAAVVTCAAGNPYGVSRAAYPFYEKMIRQFSPAEIGIMLNRIRSGHSIELGCGMQELHAVVRDWEQGGSRCTP
jgi:hypothetical protein